MEQRSIWAFIFFLLNVNFFLGKEKIIYPEELQVKIGLALSGGGARGIAQIGVLKAFERENIPIYAITGTSIGAFVGGLYAVGYTPEELEEIALNTNWENVLTILKEQERTELFFDQKIIQDRTFATLRFKNFKFVYPQALSLGWKFNSFIQKLIWNGAYYSNNFNELKLPFRAIATDVASGNTIVFSQGNLIRAMKASSAIPLLNTPVQIDSMLLVDGGLFSNVPVEALKEFNPDIIIAVNTTSPQPKREELNKPWTLASQIISIYMNKYVETALKKADFVITPAIGNHPNDNFKGLDSLVVKGEIAASNFIEKLINKIQIKKDSVVDNIITSIGNEFNLSGKIFLKKNILSEPKDNFEYYEVSDESGEIQLSDFLKNLDPNSIAKLKFINSQDKIWLEVEIYPKIRKIICQSDIHKIKETADSVSIQFLGKHDNPKTRKRIVENLRKAFAKIGYSFAKITINPNFFSDEITIEITPNRIGKIFVDKNIKTSDYIVRREISIKEGDFTNSEKLVKSWNNLISSGLFSDVLIDFQIDTNKSLCDIFISAQERGTQVLNILLRIDNERNLQGGADFIHENLFNTGTRLLTSLTGSKTDFLAKASISQPRIWKTNYSLSFETYYYYRVVPIYVRKSPSPLTKYESFVEKSIATERYNFNITAGTQLERLGNLFFGLKFENQRYYDINEEKKPDFYTINNFIVGLVYDSRDKAEFSTTGKFINLEFESQLYKTKRGISFTRAIFAHSNNIPIKDFVLRPSILFGFADNGLPFPEFFKLGGEGNFFGLRQEELLGRQIFNGKLDFQYRLPFKIYFDTYLTFTYNIGSVWGQFDVIRISELKHGLGFSIGLDTPIGPVTFSAGKMFYFLKNPTATVWGPLQLYFSIGKKIF